MFYKRFNLRQHDTFQFVEYSLLAELTKNILQKPSMSIYAKALQENEGYRA